MWRSGVHAGQVATVVANTVDEGICVQRGNKEASVYGSGGERQRIEDEDKHEK